MRMSQRCPVVSAMVPLCGRLGADRDQQRATDDLQSAHQDPSPHGLPDGKGELAWRSLSQVSSCRKCAAAVQQERR
jgi:hypothetical protein